MNLHVNVADERSGFAGEKFPCRIPEYTPGQSRFAAGMVALHITNPDTPTMSPLQIVLDTNILVAALRSRRGASYRLFSLLGTGRFELNLLTAKEMLQLIGVAS